MTRIRHARVSLALHELQSRPGPTLLCLHALGGASRDFAALAPAWPGRVLALDFSGHGDSDPLRGGGYYPECLAGDADAALAAIGPARLAGAGLGAYVALLLAGGRPDAVPAALLLPGAGLEGGGAAPDYAAVPSWHLLDPPLPGCDPAVRRMERDLRPPDYAAAFALTARRLLFAGDGAAGPPWWQAALESPSAAPAPADPALALALLASAP